MNVIICLDNKNGMLFNNRRQSQDRKVIEDIQKETTVSDLWVTPYSKALFKDSCMVSQRPWEKAGKKEYCFLEEVDPATIWDKIDYLIVYRWDRVYPADRICKINFSKLKLVSECEFSGHSHEKIKKEVYAAKRQKE